MKETIARRLLSETLATSILLATIVGSGIMAARLAGGNDAIALLGNTIATGAILFVLITIFGPLSGAHMNPAVSLSAAILRDLSWRDFIFYSGAQILGAMLGVFCAHLMFDLHVLQVSTKLRLGPAQFFSECVATFGLMLTILGCVARAPASVPIAVGLYITGAYWFTASTSFANPAVTMARALTDTFAGIAPVGVLPFIAAQLIGMLAGLFVGRYLWVNKRQ
jgi:glycerol uptake facilitator-like aquaporin